MASAAAAVCRKDPRPNQHQIFQFRMSVRRWSGPATASTAWDGDGVAAAMAMAIATAVAATATATVAEAREEAGKRGRLRRRWWRRWWRRRRGRRWRGWRRRRCQWPGWRDGGCDGVGGADGKKTAAAASLQQMPLIKWVVVGRSFVQCRKCACDCLIDGLEPRALP